MGEGVSYNFVFAELRLKTVSGDETAFHKIDLERFLLIVVRQNQGIDPLEGADPDYPPPTYDLLLAKGLIHAKYPHPTLYCKYLSKSLLKQIYYHKHWLNAAPVAETGFSHRLTAYKIVGHFLWLSSLNISLNNQVENILFRISNISVPCPHPQLRGRTVIKKLGIFFGPWGWDRSQSPPCWIFRVNQIHQSTASERTTQLDSMLC